MAGQLGSVNQELHPPSTGTIVVVVVVVVVAIGGGACLFFLSAVILTAGMLDDIEVGVEGHFKEIGLEFNNLEEGPEEVVDASVTDEVLELIKNLVHPPQKYLPVV